MAHGISDRHQQEVLEVLQQVKRDTAATPLQRFPTNFSPSILAALRGNPVDKNPVGHSIRQIHDFYGWMAKANLSRGHCAGAIYRTSRFMSLPRTQRDGSKADTRNIHIEHTVPINTLKTVIEARHSEFTTAGQLHRFLLDHSICVAFHHEEESWLPGGHDGKWNDAFERTGRVVHQHPFRRYRSLLESAKRRRKTVTIVNVVTGHVIDIETYTFEMHVETLLTASRLVAPNGPYLYGLDAFRHPGRK